MELAFNIGGLLLQLATVLLLAVLLHRHQRATREVRLLKHQIRAMRLALNRELLPEGPEEYHRRMTAGG